MNKNIYEILQNIAVAYHCELVESELIDDVLEMITDELKNDLEKVLNKINQYGKLANK